MFDLSNLGIILYEGHVRDTKPFKSLHQITQAFRSIGRLRKILVVQMHSSFIVNVSYDQTVIQPDFYSILLV